MFPKATARIVAERLAAKVQFDRHAAFVARAADLARAVAIMTMPYGPYSLVRCGADAFLSLTTELDDAVAWWCDSEQEGFREDTPWPSKPSEVFDAIWRVANVLWSPACQGLPPDALIAELRTALPESDVREICAALGLDSCPVVPT